jgi:hypothetical protein
MRVEPYGLPCPALEPCFHLGLAIDRQLRHWSGNSFVEHSQHLMASGQVEGLFRQLMADFSNFGRSSLTWIVATWDFVQI